MASHVKTLVCSILLIAAARAEAQSVGDKVDVGNLHFSALPAQILSPGRCGLFLWSKSDRPVFVLFATEAPAQATVRLDGRTRQLKRASTSGQPIYGHFEKQTFTDNTATFEVDLTYDRSKAVQDGAVIEQGFLRATDKNGFEAILPVGGMIGCKKA